MGKHNDHNMHEHSLAAYDEEGPRLSHRQDEILTLMKRQAMPLTARQILRAHGRWTGRPSEDMNTVRPRITELVKLRLLYQAGKVRDIVTGKTVATFTVRAGEEQQELAI